MNAPAFDAMRQRAEGLAGLLEHDPGNTMLLADLVDLLIELGETDKAQLHVATALKLQPQDQSFKYRQAVISHRQGDLSRAQALLSELVAQGVNDPVVKFELGRVQFEQGDFATSALTLEPLSASDAPSELRLLATLMRVRSLHHLGNLAQAIKLAEFGLTLVAERPDPALISALATLYLDAERSADAARLYGLAEAEGHLTSELLAVGGYLALGEADTAVAQARFKASLASSPRMGRAHLGLGLSYASQGNLVQACAALEDAVQTMPAHLGTWQALGWMQLLTKDLDAAQSTFEKAMAIDHNFGETHGGLAIVAALRGDDAAAQGFSRSGHKLDPKSFNVAAARLLLAERERSIDSAEFQSRAFQVLTERVFSSGSNLQALFGNLTQSGPRTLH